MKKSLAMFALSAALATTSGAQEPATSVQTSGFGELNRASETMIALGGGNISIRLPYTVRKGEVISIQYGSSGNTVSDSFMVTGITVDGEACTLESRREMTPGTKLIDTISIKPCNKLR